VTAASPLGYEGVLLRPTEYLRFEQVPNPGKKTAKWNVISQRNGDTLGRIEWYGPWRQYAFRPAEGTIYNYECLFDLQDRIATCNRWHRNILANRRAVA
jgi:hypothetical protein